MANSYLTALAGAGITQGFSEAAQYERDRPVRELRLRQAQLQQKQAEAQFSDYEANQPVREAERDKHIAEAKQQAYSANSSALKAATYDAFTRYNADKDVRHLNTFLQSAKTNPLGQAIYSNYARLDKLSSIDPSTAKQLLLRSGYSDPDAVLNESTMQDELIVATRSDGGLDLIPMNKLYAGTGYTQYMTNQQLATAKDAAEVQKILAYPDNAESKLIRDIAKEAGISLLEAAKRYKEFTKSSGGSALERIARQIKGEKPWISDEQALEAAGQLMKTGGTAAEREAYRGAYGGDSGGPGAGGTTPSYGQDSDPYKEQLDKVNARVERTADMKNTDAADQTRRDLDKLAGGSFFKMDFSNADNRRKAGALVHRLEQLTNSKLSTEDKRTARNIRDLINLGSKAGAQLTSAETGILDNMLTKVRTYVTDNVKGTEGRSAYETFRNLFRNALYGSSLTNSEIKAFESAAGSLSQQTGPVLQQLNVQMGTLKNQLQAIYDMNDEYVSAYYLGADLETVDRAIEAIDQRLKLISGKLPNAPRDASELPQIDLSKPKPGATPSLDDIFGGK